MISATYHANYLTLMAVIGFLSQQELAQHPLADTCVNLMKVWFFLPVFSECFLWSRYIKNQRTKLRIYYERYNYFSNAEQIFKSGFLDIKLKQIFPF